MSDDRVPFWMQNARRKEEPDYLKGPDRQPMKFYISFGQTHAHRVDGFTYDCDSLMLVEAPDERIARLGINKLTDRKWSGFYQESQLSEVLHYFPRGVINEVKPIKIYAHPGLNDAYISCMSKL